MMRTRIRRCSWLKRLLVAAVGTFLWSCRHSHRGRPPIMIITTAAAFDCLSSSSRPTTNTYYCCCCCRHELLRRLERGGESFGDAAFCGLLRRPWTTTTARRSSPSRTWTLSSSSSSSSCTGRAWRRMALASDDDSNYDGDTGPRRGGDGSSVIIEGAVVNGDRMATTEVPIEGKLNKAAVVAPPQSSNHNEVSPPQSVEDHVEPAVQQQFTDVGGTRDENDDDDAFELVASLAYRVLVESDKRRDAVGKGSVSAGSSATNWIDEQSSFYLQKAVDKLRLNEHNGALLAQWNRWIKTVPCPAVMDLSTEFHNSIRVSMRRRQGVDVDAQLLPRLGCRIILLPSGSELSAPLVEPTASLIVGKLLYGGATRYRRLYASASSSSTATGTASPPRKVGIRTEVVAVTGTIKKGEFIASSSPSSSSKNAQEPPSSWCMFGGLERMYEAVDMGACAILEVILLPLGKVHDPTAAGPTTGLQSLSSSVQHPVVSTQRNNLLLLNAPWKPHEVLIMKSDSEADEGSSHRSTGASTAAASRRYDEMLVGSDRNNAFRHDFSIVVGGLQPQIDAIVRRVLDGRMIRPIDDLGNDSSNENSLDPTLAFDVDELSALGLTPVRGLLLHGPPGTGKTLLAREISKALRARAPKIVSAPELLDRWVGGSEKAVRALFADAEAELAACNNDATKSALHVIVIDEIDAVFRHRSATASDSGEATRSSVVNQILAKLDGVNAIPNVLMIGMTNRRELIDDALLRPGRLEVQIEIPLPSREGRREILQIHFGPLRRKGRLSGPLCCAIDGVVSSSASDGMSEGVVRMRKRDHLKRAWKKLSQRRQQQQQPQLDPPEERSAASTPSAWLLPIRRHRPFDLAGDATRGFSGADLAGLVRCAGSIALARARRDGSGVSGLVITLDDVQQALKEVKS